MRRFSILAALLAVAVVGCSENDQQCTQDYIACYTGCDDILTEAAADQQTCLNACESEHAGATNECSALADDQVAYVNCTLAASNDLLTCQAQCISGYAAAFNAWESCRGTCQSDYETCLGAD